MALSGGGLLLLAVSCVLVLGAIAAPNLSPVCKRPASGCPGLSGLPNALTPDSTDSSGTDTSISTSGIDSSTTTSTSSGKTRSISAARLRSQIVEEKQKDRK
mmetsp:Transcript_17041/g.28098  ORF Transcript_17041/g.28098 Transcript_17041/m.28098 type:complete len:102 (+) Transcript_17041:181-486(+)